MSRGTRRTQGVLGGRSDEVVRRVLDAAIAELAHSGYSFFRIETVAEEAQVNKTTIYRRWPNRASLVAALMDRMQAPIRDRALPDTGKLERDLVEAFLHRLEFGRQVESRAWARLLDERYHPEVEALIGDAVGARGDEWLAMVTRAIDRGELPKRTDPGLVLHMVRALVDARVPAGGSDEGRVRLAVRAIIAAARAGTLVRSR